MREHEHYEDMAFFSNAPASVGKDSHPKPRSAKARAAYTARSSAATTSAPAAPAVASKPAA